MIRRTLARRIGIRVALRFYSGLRPPSLSTAFESVDLTRRARSGARVFLLSVETPILENRPGDFRSAEAACCPTRLYLRAANTTTPLPPWLLL